MCSTYNFLNQKTMIMEERKIFTHNSVVTPLIIQAVHIHKIVFFYLYPHPYSLEVNKNYKLAYSCTPWNWKLIPWLLSLTIFTGFLGCGSSTYICLAQIFGYQAKPWLHWNFFNTITALAFNVAGMLEIVFCALMRVLNIFPTFSEMLRLEQKCKLF